ncbi:phage head closure protein [Nitratireductor aquimarinus]|nr:phage head closure protein [Nitratireductor aquimarinus]MBY6023945.1 phage head closure protein [Nitratireductor sp. DP7N14-4]
MVGSGLMAKRSAGSLDRTITVERYQVVGTNDFNEDIREWAGFITVRAARRDVSDGEKFAAGQTGSSLRSRFVIRASTKSKTISPVDRLSYDGGIWNIEGVKEGDQGDMHGRFIEITAVRSND